MRWGLGPVFYYECLASSRRWQTYAIRSCGVAVLLIGMGVIARSNSALLEGKPWRESARLGEYYFYAMIGVALTLVMLAAPAATAGAICVDRSRGTLAHILATDLSDSEIVLGKLAARFLPVLGLVACTWPVLSIGSLLGGIDPSALTSAFAVILAVGLLGCSVALTFSVWCKKSHEVVFVTYTLEILVLLIWPIWYELSTLRLIPPPPGWTLVADPFYLAFAPYLVPGRVDFEDYLGFFAVTLGASALLMLLAIWWMRAVACNETREYRRKVGLGWLGRIVRRLPGPSLDANPVLWREWHRSRPSVWTMRLLVLVGGTTSIACFLGAVGIWALAVGFKYSYQAGDVGSFGSIVQVGFGLLVLSAMAPMAMSEERQRGSLDLLAATSLSTQDIVFGKWIGTFRLVFLLMIGPGLVALAMATAPRAPWIGTGLSADHYKFLTRGELIYGAVLLIATIAVHGTLLTSLGLALAIWIHRQSRAIAISVFAFVMLDIGWPILVKTRDWHGDNDRIQGLSPLFALVSISGLLSNRRGYLRDLLKWITFWDLEVAVVAGGLLWLSVRTFDRCFDRRPDRPKRSPVLTALVIIVSGMVGVGGLLGAIVFWADGIRLRLLGWEFYSGIGWVLLSVSFGLILVSVVATLSMSGEGETGIFPEEVASGLTVRDFIFARWWQSYRLVFLLLIGPVLIALGLTTSLRSEIGIPRWIGTLPTGAIEWIDKDGLGIPAVYGGGKWESRIVRRATLEEIRAFREPDPWELSPIERLNTVALVGATILCHGASAVSLGMVLGLWIKRRRLAVAVGIGLFLLAIVGCSIVVALVEYYWSDAGHIRLMTFAAALNLLFYHSVWPDGLPETLSWVAIGDAVQIVVALLLMWLSIKMVERRLDLTARADDDPRMESDHEQRTQGAVLIAD